MPDNCLHNEILKIIELHDEGLSAGELLMLTEGKYDPIKVKTAVWELLVRQVIHMDSKRRLIIAEPVLVKK
jgi:hypothetical protein